MPKSRPELFNFLDSLTAHLHHIGKDQLALDIRTGYARGGEVNQEWIITQIGDALDDSDQLALPFAA